MRETIRAFIAFDITSDEVLSRFSEIQDKLSKTGADLKMVECGNIHVTMRFLGEISTKKVEGIFEEMDKISFKPFTIRVRGVGAFPSLNYIRVVWAGIGKGEQSLRKVFEQLEPRLHMLGFKPDHREFSPHITIARVQSGRNKVKLAHCIRGLVDYEVGDQRAELLRLKKSVLTSRGPIYSTIHEVEAT